MTSRRPLPPAPNGSSGFIAGSRASNGSVSGVVASRLAAMASAGSTTNGGVDSNSRIPSYRLSSLDRLAQRQRLFEAQPAATNGTSTPLHSTDTVSLFLSSQKTKNIQTKKKKQKIMKVQIQPNLLSCIQIV